MSDDILNAIKADNVRKLQELEKKWGHRFFSDNCFSIGFALREGSLNAAEYLASSADLWRKDHKGCIPLHNVINNPYAPNSLLKAVLQYTPCVEDELNYIGCEKCIGYGWESCGCHCKCEGTPLELVCMEYEGIDETKPFEPHLYAYNLDDPGHPRRNNYEAIKLLIEHGADPNLSSTYKSELYEAHGPLELVQARGHPPSGQARGTLDLLLEHGARPRVWRYMPPFRYEHPLVEACRKMDEESLRDEYYKGDKCIVDQATGDSAFHALVWIKEENAVKDIMSFLLAQGLSPNTGPNKMGHTPLELAFLKRDASLLKKLLEFGAKIPPIYTKRCCRHCRPYNTYVYYLLLHAGLTPTDQACVDMLTSALEDKNYRLYMMLVAAYPPIVRTRITGFDNDEGISDQRFKGMLATDLAHDRANPFDLVSLAKYNIRTALFKRSGGQSISFLMKRCRSIPENLKGDLKLKGILEERHVNVILCSCENETRH